ncbi:MAG: uroporphyrin-III C-methyltransferase, partial [Crocosphaera sp.]
IITQLQKGGLTSATPIALIRWGTRSEQEQLIGTLETIIEQVETTNFEAPAIAIIGNVVELSSILLGYGTVEEESSENEQ